MIAVDAGVLIALLRQTDAHHSKAVAVLSLDHEFAVHTINLAEALVGAVRVGRAAEARRRWTELGVIELPGMGDEASRLAQLRVTTDVKMPDCCALLVAEHLHISLATFDLRLTRAARQRGITVVEADS